MIDIEKKISPLIESQFPDFYKSEGPKFIQFVKAYYEWLELEGNPIYESRSIPSYLDIDTTVDKFIIHFKEKYLKNIQFDIATNKVQLIKHALDLYRSKGTEQSIDLFFKIIYGTEAEVSYPADKIIRPSDGLWVRPQYLEISYNDNNVDYVGKQIIGSISNATAFVERYIRRKLDKGYVNVLYVSDITKEFKNNDIIGIKKNNKSIFDTKKNSRVIGSLNTLEIESGGKDYSVGDIVELLSSGSGVGGEARVTEIKDSTGVVEFNLKDGGYGYTLDSDTIVSEKVITASNIISSSDAYFKIFEKAYEPIIELDFTDATKNFMAGDKLYRYANNIKIAEVTVISVDQNIQSNGTLIVNPNYGPNISNTLYYNSDNTNIITSTSVLDKTICSDVMGLPKNATLTLTGELDVSQTGKIISQYNSLNNTSASAIIDNVNGKFISVSNLTGTFKNSEILKNESYTTPVGQITLNNINKNVIGTGTDFDSSYVGQYVYDAANNFIGIVNTVSNNSFMVLDTIPTANSMGIYHLTKNFNISLSNTITSIGFNSLDTLIGVYNIKREINNLKFNSLTSNNLLISNNIYQYDSDGNVKADGKIISVSMDNANSGTISFMPISGYFIESENIYTNANTAQAILLNYNSVIQGGDYIVSPYTTIYAPLSNTSFAPVATSFGLDASYNIGTLSDINNITVNVDKIDKKNSGYLDYRRKQVTISSNTGFALGDLVVQYNNRIAINPSTSIDTATGFITLPTANSNFSVGDIVKYNVSSGNTVIDTLVANNNYYVYHSNSTGIILSYAYTPEVPLNTSTFTSFNSTPVNETGHFLSKESIGTIYGITASFFLIKDLVRPLSVTGGTSNTTSYANSVVYKYSNSLITSDIISISPMPAFFVKEIPYSYISLSAQGYGFPKNTQGNMLDKLHTLLTYKNLDIGTISTLSNINSGSGYTASPFVISHQPDIAPFNRKDLVISLANTTQSFAVGEKVFQTIANNIFYNVKVDSGVNVSNTFTPQISIFDTGYDISTTNKFIYNPYTTLDFNGNTDVSLNKISIVDNIQTGDYVRYYTGTGNTVLGGLANNNFYYIKNYDGNKFELSTTPNGATLNIVPVNANHIGHHIKIYRNSIANTSKVLYNNLNSTTLPGLTANANYYIVNANTIGYSLSDTIDGLPKTIGSTLIETTQSIETVSGYTTNDNVYQNIDISINANTDIINIDNFIVSNTSPYSVGNKVLYTTTTGNTPISGLANNAYYFINFANSSGFKLSNTIGGNTNPITASSVVENGHNFIALSNAIIQGSYRSGADQFLKLKNVDNGLAVNYPIKSYTDNSLNGIVEEIVLQSFNDRPTGIVKKNSNTSNLLVRRLTFENNFVIGQPLLGEASSATGIVTNVIDDEKLLPIGLNAEIVANTVTAKGQVSKLEVSDSGFGYFEGEFLSFKNNNDNFGTVKAHISSSGKSKGYYSGNKGFLSDDNYIQDGDFYQEYSYEILTKVSFERFSDMFKKVMHTAGTKFFASLVAIDTKEIGIVVTNNHIQNEIVFTPATSVDIVNDLFLIPNNPFVNGDMVRYYNLDTYPVLTGLSNSTVYNVVNANSISLQLANTTTNSIINISNNTGLVDPVHYLIKEI